MVAVATVDYFSASHGTTLDGPPVPMSGVACPVVAARSNPTTDASTPRTLPATTEDVRTVALLCPPLAPHSATSPVVPPSVTPTTLEEAMPDAASGAAVVKDEFDIFPKRNNKP
jgi:hypothetical protein